MNGSLRKRVNDSWQLRVYVGTDATTGKERWVTTTVHGSKRYAHEQLAEFVRQAEYTKVRAGTITELLDRWVLAAAPKWAPSTRRLGGSTSITVTTPSSEPNGCRRSSHWTLNCIRLPSVPRT